MGLLNSSIARKIAMALSALFLMVFLLQHLLINIASVISPTLFNEISHFMGTNPVVQFVAQPILMFGVLFHFIMGFILELKNRKSRNSKYAMYKGSANASWMSRNMIISGVAILLFLVVHLIDFWVPEMNYKYIQFAPEDPTRYFEELQHKFVDLWRVILYVVCFVFLGLHLQHGFQSAFQSVGVRKYAKVLQKVGSVYSIVVPLGFIIVALFHYINH